MFNKTSWSWIVSQNPFKLLFSHSCQDTTFLNPLCASVWLTGFHIPVNHRCLWSQRGANFDDVMKNDNFFHHVLGGPTFSQEPRRHKQHFISRFHPSTHSRTKASSFLGSQRFNSNANRLGLQETNKPLFCWIKQSHTELHDDPPQNGLVSQGFTPRQHFWPLTRRYSSKWSGWSKFKRTWTLNNDNPDELQKGSSYLTHVAISLKQIFGIWACEI